MQARPLRSAWRLQKTSVPAANSSRTDGMIKSSFFIGRTSSSNILSQVGTQKISRWDAIPGLAHRSPQSGSPRQRASLVCSPWLPHFRWRAAVKAQPVRTRAGSAVDPPVSTGLDCGRPAEYVPRKGSKSSKRTSYRSQWQVCHFSLAPSLFLSERQTLRWFAVRHQRAVRFIFRDRTCGVIARSMLPPIFCAMS